jgi:coenzyme PQQ precursor peptide PqqA
MIVLAVPCFLALLFFSNVQERNMAWTTPVLVEICIGLEINGYMPADGYVPPEF